MNPFSQVEYLFQFFFSIFFQNQNWHRSNPPLTDAISEIGTPLLVGATLRKGAAFRDLVAREAIDFADGLVAVGVATNQRSVLGRTYQPLVRLRASLKHTWTKKAVSFSTSVHVKEMM